MAHSWFRRPTSYRVRPTLRGLVVEPDESQRALATPTVFPWTRVTSIRQDSSYTVCFAYDENGNFAAQDGRRICLILRGRRACAMARRAQRRAFRQAWHAGCLDLTERYGANRRSAWIMLAFAAVWGLVVIAAGGPPLIRVWQIDPLLPLSTDYYLLARSLILGQVALLLLLAGALLWFPIATLRAPVEAQFTREGLRALFRSGRQFWAPWSDLSDIRRGTFYLHVRFQGGAVLYLPATNARTRLALSVIQQAEQPDAAERDDRARRRAPLLVGTILIAGAPIVTIAAYRFREFVPGWRLLPQMLAITGGVVLGVQWLNPVIRRSIRRLRLWRRRRLSLRRG